MFILISRYITLLYSSGVKTKCNLDPCLLIGKLLSEGEYEFLLHCVLLIGQQKYN